MIRRVLMSLTLVSTAVVALYFAQMPARGQEGGAAKGKGKKRITGPAPHLADGKPDFSGVWGTDRPFVVDIAGALPKGEALPMNDWAKNAMKAHSRRTTRRRSAFRRAFRAWLRIR